MADAGVGAFDSAQGTFGFKATADGKVTLGNTSDDVLHITGTVEQEGTSFKISGDDARVKINGDTDSHPGLELHENGSRKWIIYNDYTTDNLTFKSSADRVVITDTGRLGVGTTSPAYKFVVAGNMAINEHIRHNGDVDTRLSFPDNGKINLVADGKSVFKFDGSDIVLNNANANYDTKVMADNGQVVLHVDAGNNRVGVGTTSPSVDLDVDGDAKFSGEVIHGTTTTDLGNGTSSTLTPASSVHLLTATSITGTGGMHTMSLANGTTAGQILQLIMTTATNGQGIMISTSNILSGGNKISFMAIEPDMLGAALKFIWTGSAWALVSNNLLASIS